MRSQLYSPIPSNGSHSPDSIRRLFAPTRYERFLRTIEPGFHVLLYTLAFLGLFATVREISTLTSNPQSRGESRLVSCSCGSNVAEALARGCKYDLLASAWLPDQCRDAELSAEFDRSGPGVNGEWTYYADKAGTRVMNASEIGVMADLPGFLYYTTLEWHMVHCYFYWIKAWRTWKTGLTLEKRYDSEGHIRHCSKILMTMDADLHAVKTFSGVSLTSGE